MNTPGTDTLEYGSSNEHLSPVQFAGVTVVPDHEGWTGPLGSYGEPGPTAAYWQYAGALPDAGSEV